MKADTSSTRAAGSPTRTSRIRSPGPGEVVVELQAAAINRRDLLVRNPPGPAYEFPKPIVPGSDGAGIRRDTGEEVVIYPGSHWGPREDAAGPDWRILGGPTNGTYAELVKVPEENVYPKPAAPVVGGGRRVPARGA